jgi:hypothetical protein
MAWSDAARRAAAEARRIRSEGKSDFQHGPRPGFDKFYVSAAYRKVLASKIKVLRRKLRKGVMPDFKMQNVIRGSEFAKGMRAEGKSVARTEAFIKNKTSR